MKKQYIKPSVEAYKVNKTSIICCSEGILPFGNGDLPSGTKFGQNGVFGE